MAQIENNVVKHKIIRNKRNRWMIIASFIFLITLISGVIIGYFKFFKPKELSYLINMNKGNFNLKDFQDIREDYEEGLNIQTINYQWGEGLETGNKPKYLVLHHTASSTISPERIHEMHLNKEWGGIGYHFYIRKDGTIYRGRDENVVGAHAIGKNRDSIGICLEGNFELEKPSEAQISSLVKLSTDMIIKYNIDDAIGHRDVYSTLCPGKNFSVDSIKNKVVDELIRIKKE